MKILAVDSSAKAASVAIVDDGNLLGEFYINVGLTHSQTLMPTVESLLKCSMINVEDIDAFAVSNGPGSFTGLRIGVASIKGMAFFREVPCFPISTLFSLAYNLLEMNDVIICAVMDARREQVYNALFEVKDENVTRLTPDRNISVNELYVDLKKFTKKVFFIGDGAVLCYNKKEEYGLNNIFIAPESKRYQRASSVAFAAYDNYVKGVEPIAAENLLPEYLRLSQAEREFQKKNK